MAKILLYADNLNDRVGINEAYVHFLSMFGEVLLVTAQNDIDFYVQHGDILALPGGADVDPARYGERPYGAMRSNPYYEYLDKTLLAQWLTTEKPIIAICRGMQTLNVAMGGNLYQHIIGHLGDSDKRWATPNELYTDIPGYRIHKTNSFHHQAIKRLAPGFDILGWSEVSSNCPSLRDRGQKPITRVHYKFTKEGKVVPETIEDNEPVEYYSHIEIIKHRDRPYIGFQYHPEEFFCPLAIQLIEQTTQIEADGLANIKH